MDAKEKLLAVVNALINDNVSQAATDFHEVMASKMRNVVNEKEDDTEKKAEKLEDEAIGKLKKAQKMEKAEEKK